MSLLSLRHSLTSSMKFGCSIEILRSWHGRLSDSGSSLVSISDKRTPKLNVSIFGVWRSGYLDSGAA